MQGESAVTEMWQNSGLEWSLFVPPTEVHKFLSDRKLDWLENVKVSKYVCYSCVTVYCTKNTKNSVVSMG